MSFPFGEFGETVTRRRMAAGTWGTDGRFDHGSKTDTSITASVQPAGPKVLQQLPEGFRTRSPIELFSESELRTASQHDDTDSDYVQVDSVWYKVVSVEAHRVIWAHYHAVAIRLQEGETVPT